MKITRLEVGWMYMLASIAKLYQLLRLPVLEGLAVLGLALS